MIDDNKFMAQLNYLDRLIQLHKSGIACLDSAGKDSVLDRIKRTIDAMEKTIDE
ncbi:hypothetical protein [Sporolactobacillus shoreae]|uniref:hypothetical protein n=1 Tax=Sporolactobacillus shoreae TaxID=1465501 RepID=UPI001432F557|nr:hypothetical protein [Sporolactobacillus shoreae]